jgi:4'-phosphopantetheinyl transferase
MANVTVSMPRESLDLWYFDLDLAPDAMDSMRPVLSPDEAARAGRFHRTLHRDRYVVGRAVLRHVLATHLRCTPTDLEFCYGPMGKPSLRDDLIDLAFNLSHSEGAAVIGVTRRADIGVDIERIRPIPDVHALAREVFSLEERVELTHAADPVRAFLNGWTRKEAFVKAIGIGCGLPLTGITMSLSEKPALLSADIDCSSASEWAIVDVPHPSSVVAVAIRYAQEPSSET